MPGQEHVRLVTLKDNFPAGWTEKHRLLQVRVLDKLFQHQASHGGETISDEIVNMVHSKGILASHPEYNFHNPSSPVVDAPPPSTSSTHKPDSTSPILGAEGWDSAAGEKPPHDADSTEECPVPTPTSQRADVTHEERGGTPPSTTPPTEEAPTRVDGGPRTEDKHVAQDPLPSPAGNDNPDANPLPPGASSACTDPRPPNCGTTPTAENDGVTDAPIEDPYVTKDPARSPAPPTDNGPILQVRASLFSLLDNMSGSSDDDPDWRSKNSKKRKKSRSVKKSKRKKNQQKYGPHFDTLQQLSIRKSLVAPDAGDGVFNDGALIPDNTKNWENILG